MKKIILLLIIISLSLHGYAQAEFPEGIQLSGNIEDNAATWVTVQSENGNLNKVLKSSFLPSNFSNVVYVNSTSPTTATIFDLNNPPTVNDDGLKNSTSNLYIGNDGTTWTYKTSPAGYNTYVPPPTSNFFLTGTTIDAGNSKTVAVSRSGNLALSAETASTIASFDANKNIKSLPLATYPSLTELSYVKGLTSSAQTQITARALDANVLHNSGNESFTGTKSTTTSATAFNITKTAGSGQAIMITGNASETAVMVNSALVSFSSNTGTRTGFFGTVSTGANFSSQLDGTGNSFFSYGTGAGTHYRATINSGAGSGAIGFISNNQAGSTSFNFVGQDNGVTTFSVNRQGAIVASSISFITTATASLDFPSTGAGAESSLTITLAGAAVGDPVALGSPVVASNTLYIAFVSAADTVTVRYRNMSVSAIDPAAATFKIKLFK